MTSSRQCAATVLDEIRSELIDRGGQRVDVVELGGHGLVARVDSRRVRVWCQPTDHYGGEWTVLLRVSDDNDVSDDVPILPVTHPTHKIVDAVCGYLNLQPPPVARLRAVLDLPAEPNPEQRRSAPP